MSTKIWPAFMCEPEYEREQDAQEWDLVCTEWEAETEYRENVRLGFEEPRS